jgi:hypothetical protein
VWAASPTRSEPSPTGPLTAATLGLLLSILMSLAVVAGVTGASLDGVAGGGAQAVPSELAREEIPARYLSLYQLAGERYGLDWAILAGIGRVECDHGLDTDPSCTREGSTNTAGAGGPMQFIASTWAVYGVDGDGDGRSDRWDPADAIYAAANYLSHSGAPHDYRAAILDYNHAAWYVEEVERWAARYRGSSLSGASDKVLYAAEPLEAAEAGPRLQAGTSTQVRFVAGERAALPSDDGHLALIPTGVPAVVQAMVIAGNELSDLPYGPAGHPDPRGALQEDCSSTVNYVLYRAGVRPISEIVAENPLAQDYVRWDRPGPGRWVTIYATSSPTPHVFMVIAGLRLDTSRDGTDTGPNRGEAGPRWRLLDHIPTWAHWSVRHPPGL